MSDKELSHLFEKDAANISPDASVRERLEYTFMLKSSSSKATQNSFLGMFYWLFSWSQLPLKATLVSFVLLVSILNIHPIDNQFLPSAQDTTFNTIPLHIDSSEISPFFADTCKLSKELTKTGSNTNDSPAFNPLENSETKNSKINLLPVFYKRFPAAVPTPISSPYYPVSRKLKPVDLNNITPVESRFVA